jgi:hypothetical protein
LRGFHHLDFQLRNHPDRFFEHLRMSRNFLLLAKWTESPTSKAVDELQIANFICWKRVCYNNVRFHIVKVFSYIIYVKQKDMK